MKRLICVLLSVMCLIVFSIANVYGSCEGFADCKQQAEQGNAEAQNKLGLMYGNGNGVTKNLKESVNWFRQAAEQGHIEAKYYLGWMYQNGLGVEKDLDKARYWYEKSADQGHDSAKAALKNFI